MLCTFYHNFLNVEKQRKKHCPHPLASHIGLSMLRLLQMGQVYHMRWSSQNTWGLPPHPPCLCTCWCFYTKCSLSCLPGKLLSSLEPQVNCSSLCKVFLILLPVPLQEELLPSSFVTCCALCHYSAYQTRLQFVFLLWISTYNTYSKIHSF